MKKLEQLKFKGEVLDYDDIAIKSVLTKEAISTIKELAKRHDLKPEDIQVVGIIESGALQFKCPTFIHQWPELSLIAYLKWYYGITDEDLK